MSIIHTIRKGKPLDISTLNDRLCRVNLDITHEKRGDTTNYYWIRNKSLRGVDVSLEGKIVEVRNTVMSNEFDYRLTNELIHIILDLTGGKLYDEDNERLRNTLVFTEDRIREQENTDCKTLLLILPHQGPITIFGPQRNVYFGSRLCSDLIKYANEPDRLKQEMFNIALRVQYHLPAYESASLMQLGRDDNRKILQVLSNSSNILIKKYDYLLIYREDNPIIITHEDFNGILPTSWELVDEFQVIAPVCREREWIELVERASGFDQIDLLKDRY
jgi:hypothetical protein